MIIPDEGPKLFSALVNVTVVAAAVVVSVASGVNFSTNGGADPPRVSFYGKKTTEILVMSS